MDLDLHSLLKESEIGLAELRELIEADLQDNKTIELAEGHHLAWCMARHTIVRLGSLGLNKHAIKAKELFEGDKIKCKYLIWNDVRVLRDPAHPNEMDGTLQRSRSATSRQIIRP